VRSLAQDYYSILGVPKDATTQEIKRAFRQIARECHPDVSGGDPDAEGRFKEARQAYETLMDPVTRARYDRRGQRRKGGGGSFFEAFYNRAKEADQARDDSRKSARGARPYARKPTGGGARKRRRNDPGNDLDLEDLFSDFGDFGFGGAGKGRTGDAKPPPRSAIRPERGADVQIELDIPADVATEGGSVTAVYYRLQRADSWRPGSTDPGVVRVQDIADVRVVPKTRDNEVLRERGLGDAGVYGGPFGDLVVRVRLVTTRRKETPPEPPPREAAPAAEEPEGTRGVVSDGTDTLLDITLAEAVLGGRVEVVTPGGKIRLSIPAGTSSHSKLRLKGKGVDGRDLFVSIRVQIPKQLDDESRTLIEKFAALNPRD
jgi:curved DNA-binding protein